MSIGIKNAAYHLRLLSCPQMDKIRCSAEKGTRAQQIRRIILVKDEDILHKPCLMYGLKGLAYFSISVQCCEQDLHAGIVGGSLQ
jgi:hypothetical protein